MKDCWIVLYRNKQKALMSKAFEDYMSAWYFFQEKKKKGIGDSDIFKVQTHV